MKTKFLITSIVISVVVAAVFFYVSPPFAYYDLEIQGMKDTYHTGEEYSFYYTLTGYGNTCHSWLAEYPDENGKIQRAGEAVDCTRPSNKELDYDSRKDLRQFSSTMPMTEGKYNVTVSLENLEPAVHEFTVWTGKDDSVSKTSANCMTIEQSKETAPFFKIPDYLPEGYNHMCSQSGTPFESYIVYYHREIPYWNIPELVSDGAIFIYQIDEKNMVDNNEFQTYGSPEQRIRETYNEVMEKNPSLNPQLITINGMLAYAVDSCNDCGTQTAKFTDGTTIQKSTSSETRIKFYDENGVTYLLETTLPLSELIKVAESLQ